MNSKKLDSPGAAMLAGIACFSSVALALISQYKFDMQPCPWCILQRLIFILIGLNCFFLAAFKSKAFRRISSSTGFFMTACGMASAVWQQFYASSSSSCNLTLADKIISKWTHLSEILPFVFEAHSSCADAQFNLLGVPYAFWSLALFSLMAVFFLTRHINE